jgi:hypothetical protein
MLSGVSRTDVKKVVASKLRCRKTKHNGNDFTHLDSVLHHLSRQDITTLAISSEERPLSGEFLGHTRYGRLHDAPQSQGLGMTGKIRTKDTMKCMKSRMKS